MILWNFLPYSVWGAAVGNCHIWHVSIPWHRSVSGLWPPGERLPYGTAWGMSAQSLRTHESMWVDAVWTTFYLFTMCLHRTMKTWIEVDSWVCPFIFLTFLSDLYHVTLHCISFHTDWKLIILISDSTICCVYSYLFHKICERTVKFQVDYFKTHFKSTHFKHFLVVICPFSFY